MTRRLTLAQLGVAAALWATGCQQSLVTGVPGSDGGDVRVDASVDFGLPPDWASCGPGDTCELAIPGCCADCGRPTVDSYVAVNARFRAEQRAEACMEPGSVPCPACEALPNPFLVAQCIAGQCEVVDFEPAVSACNRDEDCRLRSPDCCECGGRSGEGEVVAIARRPEAEQAFADLVCPADALDCPECAPTYPDTVQAVCVAGFCGVEPAG